MSDLDWHGPQKGRQPEGFYEILRGIRQRPGMYFAGTRPIDALEAFLFGYETAMALSGQESRLGLGTPFSVWLVETGGLNGGPNLGWPAILRMNFNSDEAAYEAFFDYFHEYGACLASDQAQQVGDGKPDPAVS